MRQILTNRYLLALLVVAAVGAEFGLARISHPATLDSSRVPAPARVTVSSAVRACPAPGSVGATAAGVALAAASAGTGKAAIERLSPAGSASVPPPVRVLTAPGRLALVRVPGAPVLASGRPGTSSGSAVPTGPARGGVMIHASGAMARGFEAEQTAAGGLATVQCPGPGTDFWFVGPGQKSAADIRLYLMNAGGQAAAVTVHILTDSGPVLGSADAGIGVPAHGLVVQSLAKLLHGSRVAALNVTTSVGQVAASVLETSRGGEPGAWLPAAQRPATRQVLPGLPGTPGERKLYIAVPGGDNAQVKVTAVTAKGSYHPTGGSGINLPGGAAVAVALPSLGGIPAAVLISSSVPVTASMALPGGAAGAPGAFTAAAGPVLEQGVVAGNPAGPGGTSDLILSAPHAAARVRVAELPSAGPGSPAPRVVTVAAGHTVVVALAPPRAARRKSAFAVVVTPLAGSGPVYAGRVTRVGRAVRSVLPVTSSLSWVPLPAVRNSLTTALP